MFAQLADPTFLDLLPGTWEDEPIQWRRAFVRRFVRQVEIRREKAGQMAIAVLWADGVTTRHAHKARVPMGSEELAVIKAALASPECPPRRGAPPGLPRCWPPRGTHEARA